MPRKKKNPPRKPTRYSALNKKSTSALKKRLSYLRSLQAEYRKRCDPETGRTPRRHKGWTYMGLCDEVGRTFVTYTDRKKAR